MILNENPQKVKDKMNKEQLGIHFDVGHASIGWAVTSFRPTEEEFLRIRGTGVVLFPADDCLANHRRAFRRQRRHVRATRQRIARMKTLLLAKGVLSESELDANTTASPWKLAAAALRGRVLSWIELWSVLRWYAHNRGYDGNALSCLRSGRGVDLEDIKKNEAARAAMARFGTSSMAETMCAVFEIDPEQAKSSTTTRFKGLNLSFDRSIVEAEAVHILESHVGRLPGLDRDLVHLLTASPVTEPACLRGRHDLPFRVPARFWGGVLFGQLAPRFDNRLIGSCPVSGRKLPLKATPDFLRYRWAMMLANTRVGEANRPLSPAERAAMTERVRAVGGFAKGAYKKAIAETTGEKLSNIDALLLAPEADKSLVCYPGLYALHQKGLDEWLDPSDSKKLAHRLFRGKTFRVRDIAALVPAERKSAFEDWFSGAASKGRGKKKTDEERWNAPVAADLPSGRAPFAREVLAKAASEALAGIDPRERGGVLYRDATKEDALPESEIDLETNNHLVRHRVKILLRLLKDIVHDYAENNPARVSQVTIEMARDLKDLSGKTNKEIESEMALRTAQHNRVARNLAEFLGQDPARVSAGLIRKARVAEDLAYTCPYTGAVYDLQDVVSRNVDLDHILPRSQRATDSLDSMALTFTEVNRMKGARSGLEFIRDCGGQRVPGRENLVVLREEEYRKRIEELRSARSTTFPEDRRRQERRKENLLRLRAADTGMTEGMLTRTSYITALAMKAVRGYFAACGRMPRLVSVPGRVTAFFRMQWKLLGLLARTDPRVLDEAGELRLKSEIRDITHMHHAVDAITLGLAATLLPADGTFWATVCKRRVTAAEEAALRKLRVFRFSANHEPQLVNLPGFLSDSIVRALDEKRVVVHQPQERRGLLLEQNAWGVVREEGDKVVIRQRARNEKGNRIPPKIKTVQRSAVFGLEPEGGRGKLKAIKGVLVRSGNFGVALSPTPTVIPVFKVWKTLGKMKNGQRLPAIVRNGCLISVPKGTYQGVWRVKSVKNNQSGVALDLVVPQAIAPVNKSATSRINAKLSTMIRDGLKILEPRYTGISLCPTTSSTSPNQAPSSP